MFSSPLHLCTLIVRARILINLSLELFSFTFCLDKAFCLYFSCFGALALGKKQATITEEDASELEASGDPNEQPRLVRPPQSNRDSVLRSLSTADGNNTSKCVKVDNMSL